MSLCQTSIGWPSSWNLKPRQRCAVTLPGPSGSRTQNSAEPGTLQACPCHLKAGHLVRNYSLLLIRTECRAQKANSLRSVRGHESSLVAEFVGEHRKRTCPWWHHALRKSARILSQPLGWSIAFAMILAAASRSGVFSLGRLGDAVPEVDETRLRILSPERRQSNMLLQTIQRAEAKVRLDAVGTPILELNRNSSGTCSRV